MILGDAEFSPCGTYRYALYRDWEPGRAVTFVMLNPSTADADIDDPTIRRCIGFARHWGYGRLMVVNVMAYRATKPADLPRDLETAIGPENDKWIGNGATYGELIVPAWGAPRRGFEPAYRAADAAIRRAVRIHDHAAVRCLGFTKEFGPKHPLYVPYDAELVPWPEYPF